MPRLSDSMEEGTIVRWLKQDGDRIVQGEPLAEVETDKATVTFDADAEERSRSSWPRGRRCSLANTPIARIGDVAQKAGNGRRADQGLAAGSPHGTGVRRRLGRTHRKWPGRPDRQGRPRPDGRRDASAGDARQQGRGRRSSSCLAPRCRSPSVWPSRGRPSPTSRSGRRSTCRARWRSATSCAGPERTRSSRPITTWSSRRARSPCASIPGQCGLSRRRIRALRAGQRRHRGGRPGRPDRTDRV